MKRQMGTFQNICASACGKMQSGVKVFENDKLEAAKELTKSREAVIESGTGIAVDEIRRITQSLVL